MSSEKRGERSTRPVVNLRGKPCGLKRHFRGVLRQVIGYLDALACNDPERFAWPGREDIQRHARKWKGGGTASRAQVYRSLKLAQEMGIIERVDRIRNGSLHVGFIVPAHDTIAQQTHDSCTLTRLLAERFSGSDETAKETVLTSKGDGKGDSCESPRRQKTILMRPQRRRFCDSNETPNRTPEETPENTQVSDDAVETLTSPAVLCVGLSAGLYGPNPVSLLNPVKRALGDLCEPAFAHTLRSALSRKDAAMENSSTRSTESQENTSTHNQNTEGQENSSTGVKDRMGQQYHCFIETPKGRIRFTIAEARLLLAEGWVSPPDENGRCAVVGALDLDGIAEQADWAAEFDWQNERFEDLANWFAELDDQDGPVCLPRRDRLEYNPGMSLPDPPLVEVA